jgi:molybdopterin converting factor small subunit
VAEVKFLGKLRELTGTPTTKMDLSQVGGVLRKLGEVYGMELNEMLFSPADWGQLSDDTEVLVNGRNIGFLDGLNTELKTEDKVTILYHGIRGFPGG